MQSKRKPRKTVSIEQIARMAERGNAVSGFFTNTGKIMKTDSTGQVDSLPMLPKLDCARKK